MKSLLNNLKLVYCPLTNRECDWLWEDEAMRQWLLSSKLYMIGQRSEVFFENVAHDEAGTLTFDLTSGCGPRINGIRFDLRQLLDSIPCRIRVEGNKKHIKLIDELNQIIKWYTVDKLLFECWRKDVEIQNLEEYRIFTEYDLHYVGISKQGDSFSRLFKNGHEKRAKILSQERQIVPDASLSDEILIFFFELDPLGLGIVDTIHDFDDVFAEWMPDAKALVADAEKALVKILNCQYNEVKYESYPKGRDGIFGQGLSRYAYSIGDDITFLTEQTSIRGLTFEKSFDGDTADIIAIEGESVTLFKKDDLLNRTPPNVCQ